MGPGMSVTYGTWSATDTSTATLSVPGGFVIGVAFYDNNDNICANAGTASTVTLSAIATGNGYTTYTMTPGGTAVSSGSYWAMSGGV